MSIKMSAKRGFTIVELLIVIVIIGILAAMVVTTFSGAQSRARDAKRQADLSAAVKALEAWSVATGKNFNNFGGGSGGYALGWFDGSYSGLPSVQQVLMDGGYLGVGVVDPINDKYGADKYAYMIAPCKDSDGTTRAVMARLEIPPAQTLSEQVGSYGCNGSSFNNYTSAAGAYKMNYILIANAS